MLKGESPEGPSSNFPPAQATDKTQPPPEPGTQDLHWEGDSEMERQPVFVPMQQPHMWPLPQQGGFVPFAFQHAAGGFVDPSYGAAITLQQGGFSPPSDGTALHAPSMMSSAFDYAWHQHHQQQHQAMMAQQYMLPPNYMAISSPSVYFPPPRQRGTEALGTYANRAVLSMHIREIGPGRPIQETPTGHGPDGCNLFVFHIPNDMTNLDLYSFFSPFGKVISARIMVDKYDGRSRGFGFVSYNNPASATHAIRKMNGLQIGRKRLKVQHKKDPRPRVTSASSGGVVSIPSGSGGGGGGPGEGSSDTEVEDTAVTSTSTSTTPVAEEAKPKMALADTATPESTQADLVGGLARLELASSEQASRSTSKSPKRAVEASRHYSDLVEP